MEKLLKKFVAAARKQEKAIHGGSWNHAAFCNFPTDTGNGSGCNCGLSDMLFALKEYEHFVVK
jgi:hypothetical protein